MSECSLRWEDASALDAVRHSQDRAIDRAEEDEFYKTVYFTDGTALQITASGGGMISEVTEESPYPVIQIGWPL
jgi:hypothetical protein